MLNGDAWGEGQGCKSGLIVWVWVAEFVWRLLVQVKVVMNKAYVPKFNKAFEHFLLHTGGRAVIDEMEEKLSLTPAQCQPSKDALYRFGNTSAASTWCVPHAHF